MITCGHCRNQHATVAQVRACSQGQTVGFKSTATRQIAYQPKAPRRSARSINSQTTPRWAKANMDTDWTQAMQDRERAEDEAVARFKMERDLVMADLATDKQIKFLASLTYQMDKLSTEFPLTSEEEYADGLRKVRNNGMLTKKMASASIDELVTRLNIESTKQSKAKEASARQVAKVANGRYAIEEGGTLKFFKVNTSEDGRWKGFTFVDIQASDNEFPVKNRERRAAILATIAADPREAMERYGRELGHCGHCGRTLTNEVSRERGIGPVCAEKMGW